MVNKSDWVQDRWSVADIRAPQASRTRWIGLKTLLLRECKAIARFWSVTLAPPAITTVLYFTVFGEIMGKHIGSLEGVDYIDYVAPGLIVLWVIPCSYGHTAAGFLGARFFKFIEEILVSPLPDRILMTGYVIGGMARGFLVAMVATGTMLLFTHPRIHSFFASVTALLLIALVAALCGFITALFAKSFDQVTLIQGSILTPLTYLGGVFTSMSTLPHWAQTLSFLNPAFYMVNAFRYGFLGVADVPVGVAFALLSVAAIALFLMATRLMTGKPGIRD